MQSARMHSKDVPFAEDLRAYVKTEFNVHKQKTEAYDIKYALSNGREQLKRWEEMVSMQQQVCMQPQQDMATGLSKCQSVHVLHLAPSWSFVLQHATCLASDGWLDLSERSYGVAGLQCRCKFDFRFCRTCIQYPEVQILDLLKGMPGRGSLT
jgi:hypothetical protein